MDKQTEPASIDDLGDRIAAALHGAEFDLARVLADRARSLATDPHDRVRTAFWRAQCDYETGKLEAALPLALEAAADAAALGDVGLDASLRALLARIMLAAGDSQDALEFALAAMRLIESADPAEAHALRRPRMLAERALGVVSLNLHDLSSALELCQRAVEGARGLGDQIALGAALDTVSCVLSARATRERAEGRADLAERSEREAIRHTTEAVRMARAQGHVGYESTALNNLAESMALVGEATQALALLEDWVRRNPYPLPRAKAHHFDACGGICLALGRPEEARRWFELALRHVESPMAQLVMVKHLSQALEQCAEWQAALVEYKRFHELHLRLGADKAQRSARVAAVRLDTERSLARADMLMRSNEHLQRLSSEDPLTGLANRRRLEELLRIDTRGYCVALIDVDHFKRVNDEHSHAVGDDVLRRLAGLLRAGCRDADTPTRLGGEEFVVLLRMDAPGAALAAAERLRQLVANHDWASVAPGLAITVSIGVAHGNEADDGKALLALADLRLYIAKRGGRNQVVCSG